MATKALLDQISDLPLEVRICTPSTCWSQFGEAVVVLSKLSLLENEMWKRIYDHHALDLPQVIDRIAETFSRLVLDPGRGFETFYYGSLFENWVATQADERDA